MLNKNKTCLLILPTNFSQDISQTLKVSTLIEIMKEFEKEKINVKIATYRGNKPYLNYENDEKNRKWAEKNEDFLLNVLNIENISATKFDAIFVPNYLYIYEELKIPDHCLCRIITQFEQLNKLICTIGHSTYALCKCLDPTNSYWPFVGYNITGYSLENILRENLMNVIPFIIEEMVMLQGGNFISSSETNLADDVLVVADRNLVTGMDDNSLQLCLFNMIKKI
jgi:putative intracellular protease/amidase